MSMADTKPHPSPSMPSEFVEPTDPAERERLLVEAEAHIEAGRGTPGEEVAAWLLELAAGRVAPPPCAR